MKRLTVTLIAAASLSFAGAAWGEDLSELDRFRLWNDCLPNNLLVESLPKKASEIGLNKESLATAVRSRLRAARLFSPSVPQYLYLNVNVSGAAFNVSLEYRKYVKDLVSGEIGVASTWDVGSTGTHGRDPGFIRSTVTMHLITYEAQLATVGARGPRPPGSAGIPARAGVGGAPPFARAGMPALPGGQCAEAEDCA